ncbi:MAG: hypothetical protein IT578_12400 [Verrucomicrobiae bacterium]|nr:hypothetical protein [Verrucomicrobiae bacterium]
MNVFEHWVDDAAALRDPDGPCREAGRIILPAPAPRGQGSSHDVFLGRQRRGNLGGLRGTKDASDD